jgi:hypothetical protein
MISNPRRRLQEPDLASSANRTTRNTMAPTARLAQPAERKALNRVVVGSSHTVGAMFAGGARPTRQQDYTKDLAI